MFRIFLSGRRCPSSGFIDRSGCLFTRSAWRIAFFLRPGSLGAACCLRMAMPRLCAVVQLYCLFREHSSALPSLQKVLDWSLLLPTCPSRLPISTWQVWFDLAYSCHLHGPLPTTAENLLIRSSLSPTLHLYSLYLCATSASYVDYGLGNCATTDPRLGICATYSIRFV